MTHNNNYLALNRMFDNKSKLNDKFYPFSEKQLKVLTWWCENSPYKDKDAIICDGAVRSGKTFCMSISFVAWSFSRFPNMSFAMCGKTIQSLKRNVIMSITSRLTDLGYEYQYNQSEDMLEVTYNGITNYFYLLGGTDEISNVLIDNKSFTGVFFDEVTLIPQSFVEKVIVRCSINNSKLWFSCNPESPSHWFYRTWISQCDNKNVFYINFQMKDNPTLNSKLIEKYKDLYCGVWHERFIEGKWINFYGLVYPFMNNKDKYCPVPDVEFEEYAVSCDYGTVNPASFGLWGRYENVWYRIEEYYFNSRKEGYQKTDEEHYLSLKNLVGNRKLRCITVDPSAASFIQVIKRHGEFSVIPAKNNVIDGIRRVSTALKNSEIKICSNCRDSIREFSLYRWDEKNRMNNPIKENDHAMDDIRYFVTTIM